MLQNRKKALLQNCMQILRFTPFSTSFARDTLLAAYCNISCGNLTPKLFLLLVTCFEQSPNEGA